MRARSKSVWKSTENSFVLVAWPVPKYLHIYGPLDLRSQKPTWPYNRHHLDWEFGAWLVKVGMNTLVGMVRRGMDTLVQSHPLFQALFAARHRGQGLSTSLYSATKYIIYTGISWPFSVGKSTRKHREQEIVLGHWPLDRLSDWTWSCNQASVSDIEDIITFMSFSVFWSVELIGKELTPINVDDDSDLSV